MNLDQLLDKIGDYGKDTRINFKNLIAGENTPGLTKNQTIATALACAYATKEKDVIQFMLEQAATVLTPEETEAAKAAASIMAMNNVYYRTIHLSENKDWSKLPAKLRMTVIANPGVVKVDFETYCLAVSAITGCGMCINAHIAELQKAGVSAEGVQSTIRIAAIVNAISQTLLIAS